MPPLPNIANTIKLVVLNQGSDGRKVENIFHWAYTGAVPTNAGAIHFATVLWNAWVNFVIPAQSSTLALTEVTCTDLSSSTGAQGVYTNAATPVDGSLAGGVLPLSAACLVNKYISRLYRGGHPRTYFAVGDTTKLLDDGHYTTAFTTVVGSAMVSIAGALLAATSGGCTLTGEVCVSYIDKAINPVKPYWRTVPLSFPVNSYSAQSQLATQRRRVRRTARHR